MTEESSEELPLHELLDRVHDRESFLRFVYALADEAERAEGLRRERPDVYKYGAPLRWQNLDIAEFLGGAAMHLIQNEDAEPSWQTFARFLYCGKIME